MDFIGYIIVNYLVQYLSLRMVASWERKKTIFAFLIFKNLAAQNVKNEESVNKDTWQLWQHIVEYI